MALILFGVTRLKKKGTSSTREVLVLFFYNLILLGSIRKRNMMMDPMLEIKHFHDKFGIIIRANCPGNFVELGCLGLEFHQIYP